MTPFSFSGLLAGVFSLGFGLFVLIKSTDKKIGRIWFLFALSVASWEFGAIWMGLAKSAQECLLSTRISYIGVALIAPLFYHFVRTFVEIKSYKSILMHYIVGIIFIPMIFTKEFFWRADWIWGSLYYARGGILHHIFFFWWTGLVLYSHYLLFRAYRSVSTVKRDQIKYFFVATAIGYTGGSLCYLPNFGIDLYPWGNFTVFLYPIIMSYAILKHHLMDINVVIRKTLIYSLLTAGLTSAYVGTVTLLARLLENQSATPLLFPAELFRWFSRNITISFSFSCELTALFSLAFAFFVFFQGKRKPSHLIWCCMCLAVGTWSLGQGRSVTAPTPEESMFWLRWFDYLGAILIPVFFYHFVLLVLSIEQKWLLWSSYALAFCLEGLSLTGALYSVRSYPPFTYYTVPFPPYTLFLIYFFGLVLYAFVILYRHVTKAQGQRKNQLKYIFWANILAFSGGCTSFFPLFKVPIFPYGVYAVPIYIVMTTYAIVRHQLMDISLVVRKTLLYSLVSAVLAAIYVATITLMAHLLGGRHGSASAFSSALAAICITLLFNPVRLRIQRFVDRHFFREAVDQTVLREITGAFVHEIKTPLSNIALPAELTLMDMEDLKKGKSLADDVILKIQKRMKYIMDQALLAGSKVEAVREATVADHLAKGELDLRQVLKSSLKHMDEHLRHPRVKVQFDVPASLGPIRGSARQLEIVFANLIKNAAEAMAELPANKPHEIHIQAAKNDGHVQVRVADTGPGIKPEDTERVFRSHYTTKGPGGAGMGLYLCRQIIQTHGGSIKATGARDKGAVFVIELPVDRNGASK